MRIKTIFGSTEADRSMGDLMARVKHVGETFVLTKSDKPLARLTGDSLPRRASGAEIMEVLNSLPWDPSSEMAPDQRLLRHLRFTPP